MPKSLDQPESLWRATASPLDLDRAESDLTCNIVVVGAGYTGLSAALHLCELGTDVIVVDAVEPGYGASGRNGGQVIPGLKLYPDEVRSRLGESLGDTVVQETNRSADVVFDLIDKHRIECQASRKGFIQPAFSSASCEVVRKRAELLADFGAPVELLDQQATAEYLGSEDYHIALLDKRGGSLQPLNYTRGLARTAQANGARIYSNTIVNGIHRTNSGWRVNCQNSKIDADQVLICTNGYSDLNDGSELWPGLKKSVVSTL